jgi:hypothetical protein
MLVRKGDAAAIRFVGERLQKSDDRIDDVEMTVLIGGLRVLRVAAAFFAAVRRLRVAAAFFPAARCLRVAAAFLPGVCAS